MTTLLAPLTGDPHRTHTRRAGAPAHLGKYTTVTTQPGHAGSRSFAQRTAQAAPTFQNLLRGPATPKTTSRQTRSARPDRREYHCSSHTRTELSAWPVRTVGARLPRKFAPRTGDDEEVVATRRGVLPPLAPGIFKTPNYTLPKRQTEARIRRNKPKRKVGKPSDRPLAALDHPGLQGRDPEVVSPHSGQTLTSRAQRPRWGYFRL
ncbi:hypothetical protein Esti_001295 [Eimeria stiedai]